MVIGLTVVSFGTSAPEFIVSLQAALDGSSGIALGNVIGSNIANVALILGVTAILCPIPVAGGTLKVDTPLLLVASVLLALCCHFTHALTRLEGMVGFAIMLAYVALQVVHSRKHSTDGGSETAAGAPPKCNYVRFRVRFCIYLHKTIPKRILLGTVEKQDFRL